MDLQTPLWTEQSGKQGGRDHLGMQSVGQTMLEDLTTGISNITRRIRYYSFYCWVIDSFFSSKLEKTKKNYRRYLNDMSLLFTLSSSSAHLNDSATGIDGIDFARRWLDKIISGEKTIDDTTYKNDGYRNNNWIYKAKLNNLILTTELEDTSGIPSLYPWGKKLADAFGESIDDISLDHFDYTSLKLSVLNDLEKRWCYHRVKDNKTERQVLEDILFARHTPNVTKQSNRRYSLTLMLLFINEFHQFTKQGYELWLYDENIKLPPKLIRLKRLWQLLFARNYLVFSFESLFLAFLAKIKERPLSFEEYMFEITKTLPDIFKEQLDQPLSEFISKTFNDHAPDKTSTFYEPTLIIDLDSQKRNVTPENFSKFVTNPIYCLFSLYLRYNKYEASEEENGFVQSGGTYRFSLRSLFDYIDVSIQQKISLRSFIFDLYNSNILPRHMRTAHEKYWSRSLDTYHFELEDGRYSYIKRDTTFQPMYNFMKFEEILNFFEDLDIAKRGEGGSISLNTIGKSMIKEFYE